MADYDQQLAHMTQPQPNQDAWTGPRPEHNHIPRDPKESRNQEPRREGHSQHENPQAENQDSRQDAGLGGNVSAPFNPLRITWQHTRR